MMIDLVFHIRVETYQARLIKRGWERSDLTLQEFVQEALIDHSEMYIMEDIDPTDRVWYTPLSNKERGDRIE